MTGKYFLIILLENPDIVHSSYSGQYEEILETNEHKNVIQRLNYERQTVICKKKKKRHGDGR